MVTVWLVLSKEKMCVVVFRNRIIKEKEGIVKFKRKKTKECKPTLV